MESKGYTVQDIMKILSISKTKAYDFIKDVYDTKTMFKVIKVVGSYRISKNSFDK